MKLSDLPNIIIEKAFFDYNVSNFRREMANDIVDGLLRRVGDDWV